MKKIIALFITLFVLTAFVLPCLAAESDENALAGQESTEDTQEREQTAQSANGVNYASEKTIAERVQDYVLEHWDAFAVAGYILYKLLPKVGGIAKSKKRESDVTAALNTYFGDEGSGKNVFTVQSAIAKAQEAFMNDADATLAGIQNALAPIAVFVEAYKCAEKDKLSARQIALASVSAVELMANQLNDLVLASPSVTAKKKEEIAAEWVEKIKSLHALVETAVTQHDDAE